jgi:hypothetical protein
MPLKRRKIKTPPFPIPFKVLMDGEWVEPSEEFKDIIDNINKSYRKFKEGK